MNTRLEHLKAAAFCILLVSLMGGIIGSCFMCANSYDSWENEKKQHARDEGYERMDLINIEGIGFVKVIHNPRLGVTCWAKDDHLTCLPDSSLKR